MIRPSRAGDEAGLKALWQVAFGDPPDVIDGFFSALYKPGMAVVWEEDDVIASAVYLLDAGRTPLPDGTMLRTSYAYALGTLPAYRGRGLGSAVTRAAIGRSVELGFDCNVICPAEESLFPYYTRLGYDHVLSIAADEIAQSESVDLSITINIMSTDFAAYSLLRRGFSPNCSTLYPADYLRYVEQVCRASGGGLYQVKIDGDPCLAAVSIGDNRLFVREFLPAAFAAPGVQALLRHFDLQSATVRTAAADGMDTLKQRPFVLASYAGKHRLPPDAGYFPFVLD